MKHRLLFRFALAALLVVLTLPAEAQLSAYRFEPAKVPVGRVFHLLKSNRDGSHAGRISYYVAALDRVEAVKWDDGGDEATLVIAQFDWTKFSVRRFEAVHLARGAAPAPRASMQVSADGILTMSFDPRPVTLRHWPWHSFDFDFTGLALSMPHLRDAEGTLDFWRTDFVYGDAPTMAELGAVSLRFERTENRHGTRTRRYSIGGDGLAGTRGTWWADARTGLLVEFEIPIADEPGYDDVRIRALRSEKMSAASWERFKRRAVGD